jgi:uncharacterized protein YdiU (UPF0061 family)
MTISMSKSIRELAYADRFVQALPADPIAANHTRQVQRACYSRVQPTPVQKPELLVVVPEVAALLDLDPTPTPELADILAGNRTVPGMVPYAACYGGHQFGNWAGQLGDGRAITLGEIVNARGETWEIQLKGAGPTPYSRRADGRAVLRSSLRELVCSEAMFHLGIPTTRALSLALTGDTVERDLLYNGNPKLEPGAVVCRVAPSFLRFGNFELPAARDDDATLKKLVDFTLAQFYPGHDIASMFEEIMQRTAWMVAEWMRVGFVHGVMNTDNMSILGLTIDYGPYGWVEPFDLDWTPNITDAGNRRYRFGNQPQIAHWNIAQLARALAPIAGEIDPLRQTIDRYPNVVGTHYRNTMLRKLGLDARADLATLDDDLLSVLAGVLVEVETDMTLFFRRLAQVPRNATDPFAILGDAYYAPPSAMQRAITTDWLRAYWSRCERADLDDADRAARMNAINPLYVPRNYLVQEVIEATERGDRTELGALLDVLRMPYTEQPGKERYTKKRPDWAREKPGCSMLSCSS